MNLTYRENRNKLFVTGATGNVGRAIIAANKLSKLDIYAGVRNISKIKEDPFFKNTYPIEFDFSSIDSFVPPKDINSVFLMRPPQITNPAVFNIFIERLKPSRPHIIFLSIQGADKKEFTPHRKIEHVIINSGLPYTFIRPSYFMENLVTTLYSEIKDNHRVYLPSGRMKLNWISVSDIGELVCHIASTPQIYNQNAMEITGNKNYDFYEICSIINKTCGSDIKYKNPNIFEYIIYMICQKQPPGFIAIMLLLHWLPKFGKDPEITDTYYNIFGKLPMSVDDFICINKSKFIP